MELSPELDFWLEVILRSGIYFLLIYGWKTAKVDPRKKKYLLPGFILFLVLYPIGALISIYQFYFQ